MPRRYVPKKRTTRTPKKTFKRRYKRSNRLVTSLRRVGITPPQHKYNDYLDYFTLGTNSITPAVGAAPFDSGQYPTYGLLFTRIANGDGIADRNSNMIFIKSVKFRLCFQLAILDSAEVFTPPYNVRVMLIKDSQQTSDDLALTTAEVLSNTASDWACMTAFYNVVTQRGRFKVYYDKTFRFSSATVQFEETAVDTFTDTTRAPGLKDINVKKTINFPGKGLPQIYNGSATTDIQKNGLYWLMFTDNQLAATNPTTVSMNTRVVYTENL